MLLGQQNLDWLCSVRSDIQALQPVCSLVESTPGVNWYSNPAGLWMLRLKRAIVTVQSSAVLRSAGQSTSLDFAPVPGFVDEQEVSFENAQS